MTPSLHFAKLPIESVALVGCGGTGSIFLSHLCRIWQAWVKLGGEPFEITIYDPDTVSEANLARQVFCEADVGRPKASVLAQRMQAFFGIPVESVVGKFKGMDTLHGRHDHSVIVGCTDSLAARRDMEAASIAANMTRTQWGQTTEIKEPGCYWLDMGNTMDSGQVILGGHGLPNFFDVFPKMKRAKDSKDLPSCSMAEALSRQDLFINSTVATLAGQLLWTLMRKGQLTHHGFFINLSTGHVRPLACMDGRMAGRSYFRHIGNASQIQHLNEQRKELYEQQLNRTVITKHRRRDRWSASPVTRDRT